MCKNIYQELNWEELKLKVVNGCSNEQCESLIIIRNSIIGSNKQKGKLLMHGFLPFILSIVQDDHNQKSRLNALIILGSVAKGLSGQVETLIEEYEIPSVLIKEVTREINTETCVEMCLSTLRSLFEHPSAPVDLFFSDSCILSDFMNLALTSTSRTILLSITSLLISICQTHDQQMRLLRVGTLRVLTRMIYDGNEEIQFSALCALSSMCFSNRSISDNVCVSSYHGRSLPDGLNSLMARYFTPEVQLAAARCLTYIYRSGTLLSTDIRISQKTLSCLTRLSAGEFHQSIKGSASETLAYLLEIDAELQRLAAISNHLLRTLLDFLHEYNPVLKQAALKSLSSLAANDEAIRKGITSTVGVIDISLNGFKSSSVQVGMASLMCLQSLSRSIHQLRTSFQDYAIWKPLAEMLSSQTSPDILVLVISIICNMLLDFSPSKAMLIDCGVLQKLCQFVNSDTLLLRLNCVWALMNMSFQADDQTKTDIINELGTRRIVNLMCDSDQTIVMRTLGMVRNLLRKSEHIGLIFNSNSSEILDALILILNSNSSPEIVEQVLCIIGNIAYNENNTKHIINNDGIILPVGKLLIHHNRNIEAGALYTIRNIVCDGISEETYFRLENANIFKYTDELHKNVSKRKDSTDDFVIKTLKEIVIQYRPNFSKL